MDTKALRQKILDLAIRGKLVPQDPNDEPASVLLERINPDWKPSDPSQFPNPPQGWIKVPFNYAFNVLKDKKYQILQSEIKSHGLFPVITQSANFIEGYTDIDNKLLIHSTPIIVFGDHTRNVKYIDFNFVVGADGTKLLSPTFNPKYSFYLVQWCVNNIENKGYSRHFGQLKAQIIPIPPLNEQKRIASEVEKMLALIGEIERGKTELSEFIGQAKSKILSLAIQGKLVEQDPTDEPSADLLKRINPDWKPSDPSQFPNLPQGWIKVPFNYAFNVLKDKKYQILQSEIKSHGLFPVITQSANFIEGYTDIDNKLLIHSTPIIVFGDHTRNVKYIDFNFVVGADGTKLLSPTFNPKYSFYLVQWCINNIENKGYSRHFGQLKAQIIPIPPLNEQRRIVEKIEALFKVLDDIQSALKP